MQRRGQNSRAADNVLRADSNAYAQASATVERWNLGLGTTLAERRMALRLSRDAALIDLPEPTDEITTLPSVARVLATASPPASECEVETLQEPDPECGDDDDAEDLDADLDDFYADALEDA